MAQAVVKLNSISKAFDARKVLNDLNIEVLSGQSVFVCGVNGAGKSTLLNVIAGLIGPDDGRVHVCGSDIAKEPEKTKPQIGLISHRAMLYNELTVTENLKFFADLYGVKKSKARIDELIEDIGLGPYRYDLVAILSRGWLQRLSIARALLHNPSILLADEPFTGLDSDAGTHLVSIMKDFSASVGTIIMTTHDAAVGLRCCSRVIVLDKSRIVFDEPTADIDFAGFTDDYLTYAGREK